MFWQSVLNGLSVLLHWQTYVVAIMYLVITFLPFIVLMLAGEKGYELMGKGGCLLTLVQSLLQALAVFVAVCTLFPIMIGGEEAAWSLPWVVILNAPGRTFLLLVIMLVLSIICGLVPILGRANSFTMFIVGGFVLAFLTLVMDKVDPELGIRNIKLFPGWLTSIGIVTVSGVSSWLGMLASAALVTVIFRDKEDISQLIMVPLGSMFGFIPIFIYAAWIGLQIAGLR